MKRKSIVLLGLVMALGTAGGGVHGEELVLFEEAMTEEAADETEEVAAWVPEEENEAEEADDLFSDGTGQIGAENNAEDLYTAAHGLVVQTNETDGVACTLYEDGFLSVSGSGCVEKEMIQAVSGSEDDQNTTITAIVVEEGITELGWEAFRGCQELKAVSLPQSLKVIGSGAFRFCGNLKEVSLPQGLCEIGYRAFSESGLTSLYIPDTVTTLGERIFYECVNLTYVHLPAGMTKIEMGMFDHCGRLTELEIPASVYSVELEAFLGCENLKKLTFEGRFTKIGEYAFCGCGLEEIPLGEGLESIGLEAFSFSGLKEITLPGTVKAIGANAFLGCGQLEKVVFLGKNPALTQIGESAFNGCTNLTEITLPKNVKALGYYAFENCSNLKNVTVLSGDINVDFGSYVFGYVNENGERVKVDGLVLKGYAGTRLDAYAEAEGLTMEYLQLKKPVLQSVSNKTSGVQITWKAVDGTQYYRVMKKTASGSWKKMEDVTGTSYIDRTAKNGETCCYTIRAVASGKKVMSKYDKNGMEIVYLTCPVISSCTNTAEGEMTVKWNLNNAADGYVVRYTADGVKKMKTYKNGAKVSCVLKNLTKAASYKVEIRSFKQGEEGRIYSGWSKAKTVKITK